MKMEFTPAIALTLFPGGGVCHAATEEDAYHQLRVLVSEEIQSLESEAKELPHPDTRPMREVESVA